MSGNKDQNEVNLLDLDEFSDNSGNSDHSTGSNGLPTAMEVKNDILCQQKKMVNIVTEHIGKALRALNFEGSLPISKLAKKDPGLERLPLMYYEDIIPMLTAKFKDRGFKIALDLLPDENTLHLSYSISFNDTYFKEEKEGEETLVDEDGGKASHDAVEYKEHEVDGEDEECEVRRDDDEETVDCPVIPPSLPLFPRFDGNGNFRGRSDSDTDFANCAIM